MFGFVALGAANKTLLASLHGLTVLLVLFAAARLVGSTMVGTGPLVSQTFRGKTSPAIIAFT